MGLIEAFNKRQKVALNPTKLVGLNQSSTHVGAMVINIPELVSSTPEDERRSFAETEVSTVPCYCCEKKHCSNETLAQYPAPPPLTGKKAPISYLTYTQKPGKDSIWGPHIHRAVHAIRCRGAKVHGGTSGAPGPVLKVSPTIELMFFIWSLERTSLGCKITDFAYLWNLYPTEKSRKLKS